MTVKARLGQLVYDLSWIEIEGNLKRFCIAWPLNSKGGEY